jgi:hypothetical protein
MKAILLLLIGVTSIGLTGCETDVSSTEEKPKVSFGNDQFRDDSFDRPATTATDREKTAW